MRPSYRCTDERRGPLKAEVPLGASRGWGLGCPQPLLPPAAELLARVQGRNTPRGERARRTSGLESFVHPGPSSASRAATPWPLTQGTGHPRGLGRSPRPPSKMVHAVVLTNRLPLLPGLVQLTWDRAADSERQTERGIR